MPKLSLKIAYSLYDRMICDERRLDSVDYERLQLLMQNVSWTTSDRPAIRNILDAVLFGNLDTLGIPRFVLPAEYVAAAICKFVKPVNVMIACSWSERHGSDADTMSIGAEDARLEPVSASKLFALCCMLMSKIESMEKRVNSATNRAHGRQANLHLVEQIDMSNREEESNEKESE